MNWKEVGGGLCLLAACGSAPKQLNETHPTDSLSRPLTSLSAKEALVRSKQISQLSYALGFQFDETRLEFQGRALVKFELKPKAKDLGKTIFLDLEGGTLLNLKINGVVTSDISARERFDGHRIYFKLNDLLPNSNQIEISYSHPYSNNGEGLYRFLDPVDKKIYLYSNFEPFDAHRMFPCFDQPDLKASFEISVEAPPSWQVISNSLPQGISELEGRKNWVFQPTPLISTYVVAVHAGPYAVWKSDSSGLPLRLFARKSIKKYVDADEWFKITKQGMEFFGVQFGLAYPFSKYDQIIVPDFNSGAMENVGAVTFNEKYVDRTPVTTDRRRSRANTILHEMAHMWFGDLVTLRWWNGLWLNESFATFMATWAIDQATDFEGAWQDFFAHEKQRAYWEDQLVTTHPIESPVPDTDSAEANFDGITYGKGAASLKQLSFYLGKDDFTEGLQRYFQKYSFKTTTLSEFMRMLGEASNQDLTKWQKSWLQTSGVNTVQAVWQCEKNTENLKSFISKLEVVQHFTQQTGELRAHRTQIGLFNFSKKSQHHNLVLSKSFDITYEGETTSVLDAIGKPCPDFVFPNYHDEDYVKVVFAPAEIDFLSKHLTHLPDPLTRQMVWHSFWEMVVDGKVRPQDYAKAVLHLGAEEKDTLVLTKILLDLVSPSAHGESVIRFLEGELRNQTWTKIENFMKDHLIQAPTKGDLRLVWFHAFLNSVRSPQSVKFLTALLDGKKKLKGFEINQERRWEIIQVLARNGTKGSEDLIKAELNKDPTDRGQKSAIAAEASRPDSITPNSIIKNQWFSQFVQYNPQSTELPLAKIREAMKFYLTVGQEDKVSAFIDPYFEKLAQLSQIKSLENDEYSKWFARSLFPSLCTAAIIERTTDFLEKNPDLSPSVIKSLKINRQEEERCVRARAKSHLNSQE